MRISPVRSRRSNSRPAVMGYQCLPPRRGGTFRRFNSREISGDMRKLDSCRGNRYVRSLICRRFINEARQLRLDPLRWSRCRAHARPVAAPNIAQRVEMSAYAPPDHYERGLITHYDDSSDRDKAGNGLESFPLINQALCTEDLVDWWMSPSERIALIFILEHLRPKVAIEIGTKNGGSLQVLSHFCERVYSIDIDPDVEQRLQGKFANVEYLIGPSDQMLPSLIDRLQNEGAELSFALVDGDHSRDGVRKDINNLLRFRPSVPFYIIMHDSFNPGCRRGLKQADWLANPYVHAVELDFVAGVVKREGLFRNELWGGLALGILLPHERQGRLEITGAAERTQKIAMVQPQVYAKNLKNKASYLWRVRRTLPGRAARNAKRMLLRR
jgi:Cephalosporin hydroxylase